MPTTDKTTARNRREAKPARIARLTRRLEDVEDQILSKGEALDRALLRQASIIREELAKLAA
jgi:hypothetical protein